MVSLLKNFRLVTGLLNLLILQNFMLNLSVYLNQHLKFLSFLKYQKSQKEKLSYLNLRQAFLNSMTFLGLRFQNLKLCYFLNLTIIEMINSTIPEH